MSKKIPLAITILLILMILPISGCINSQIANQWALDETQITKMHKLGITGSGVTIGIIDTGVDVDHTDFNRKSFVFWRDYVENRDHYYDDNGHGTEIAGILFSKSPWWSNYNIVGVCPDAKAIVVKAVSKTGETSDRDLSAAIDLCAYYGSDIILISLKDNPEDTEVGNRTIKSCIDATKKGIFVITPVGDDGEDDDGDVSSLASIPEVISVGSIGKDGYVSVFSSRGNQAWIPGHHRERKDPNKKPELVAPGENILSESLNGAYSKSSGTSESAAYVAGSIALLLSAYPQYKHDGEKNHGLSTIYEFKNILEKTAKKVGGEDIYVGYENSHNDRYGYGLIQVYDSYIEMAGEG